MYVSRVPNRKSPPAILIRESYREGKTVKTRTLQNITHWPKARINALERLLKGEFDNIAPTQDTELMQGKAIGSLYAIYDIARRCGVMKALGNGRQARLALMLVTARLQIQGSRLAVVRWAQEQAVEEVLGVGKFDEDDLYDSLDWLAENQEKIEAKLFRYRYGSRPPILFLYDVTSSYLEGQDNELAEYGYNRDEKRGKKQIVIGLLTDEWGDPVAVRVFKGNTNDHKTVQEQIEALIKRFKIKEVTLVGDRGMLKQPVLDKLPEGFKYITAITKPQIRKMLQEGIIQYVLFDDKVCEVDHEGVRYIIRRNPVRAEEITKNRMDKLEKLKDLVDKQIQYMALHPKAKIEASIKKIQNKIQKYNIGKWVSLQIKDGVMRVIIDEDAKKEEELLDGCYVIKTDLSKDMADAEMIHDRYRDLAQVEQDFRVMKTEHLEVRPVYVRKESRTKGHVFVTMLALLIQRHIKACLKKHFTDKRQTLQVSEVLTSLDRLCLYHQQVEGFKISKIMRPSHCQAEYLTALSVTLPKTVSAI